MRERILVYGGPGSGKSRGWLSIAMRFGCKMLVLDTDECAERMLAPHNLSNVEVVQCTEWGDYMDGIEKALRLGPDDWLVVDMASAAWDAVQNWYINEVYGQSLAEFMLKGRKQSVGSGKVRAPALKDMAPEWAVINAQYKAFSGALKHKVEAHTYLVASAKSPHPDYTPLAIRSMCAGLGAIPGGQKDLPHEVHTVLMFERTGPGQWTYTVVKDRERDTGENEIQIPLSDFALQYVIGVCGHKP